MSITLKQEAAEAVCSALWQLKFAATGESEGGRISWFHRGEFPRDVRVAVERSSVAEVITVRVEWRCLNPHGGSARRGEQRLQVECGAGCSKAEVVSATQEVVLRCLEIYRDVLTGEGVAAYVPETALDTDD